MLYGVSLKGTHGKGAKFLHTDMRKADLSGAELNNAIFNEANLSYAKLDGTTLTDACFNYAFIRAANLEGAVLDKAKLNWACLEEAYLCSANLGEAQLNHARLVGAYLDKANLGEICLEDADMRWAWLDGANLEDAASIKGAILKDAIITENQYKWLSGRGALGLAVELPAGIINGVVLRDIEGTENTFKFGSYPSETEGKKEPIDWRVLRCEYDRALVIAERIIDIHPYNPKTKDVTWETSELREWMNGEFIKQAFCDEIQERILVTCNQNQDNKRYTTIGGNATWDRVFALSIEEVNNKKYFKDNNARRADVTPYAKSENVYTERMHFRRRERWWWLRSPGDKSRNAAHVFTNGKVSESGDYVAYFAGSVRPAFWIRL